MPVQTNSEPAFFFYENKNSIKNFIMNYKNLIFLFALLIGTISSAQETIQYKNNSYKATPNWEFVCSNYALSGTLNVQIATSESGGILKLAIATTDENFVISGNVYVDLKDFSFILCTDKNYREYTNGQAVSYYNFTTAEMIRLQNTDIQNIRFFITGKKDTFSNPTGNFTAVNKSNYFSTAHSTENKMFQTANAIKLL